MHSHTRKHSSKPLVPNGICITHSDASYDWRSSACKTGMLIRIEKQMKKSTIATGERRHRDRGRDVAMPNLVYRADDRRRLVRQFDESIRSMPYLSVAFGLYWMMTVLFLYSPFLFDTHDISGFAPPSIGTVTACSSVATYFVCAARFRRFAGLDGKKWFFTALGTLMTFGAVCFALSIAGIFSNDFRTFLALSGLVLLGVTTSLACLEFGRIFALIGQRKVLFHGTVALLSGSLGALIIAPMPPIVAAIALALLPAPMVACIAKSTASFPRARILSQGADSPVHIPRRFLVTSAIQGLALGVMHNLLSGLTSSSVSLSSLGLCIGAILLMFTAVVVMQDFNTLFYRVGFPIMAVGFFVTSFTPTSPIAGSVILDAGYCYQYLLSCCLCAYLAKSFDQSPIWIIGTSTGCLLAGQLAGSTLASIISNTTSLAFLLAFALPLSALYLFSSQNMASGWGAIRPGDIESAADTIEEACRIAGSENGITKRELDVLMLLARGKTRKEISAELHLSEETIKTHAGKIYQKLSVHSKRELIEVIEQRAKSLT